jgi:hypothetical protein
VLLLDIEYVLDFRCTFTLAHRPVRAIFLNRFHEFVVVGMWLLFCEKMARKKSDLCRTKFQRSGSSFH